MEEYEGQFQLVIIRPTAIYGPGVKNLMKLANELARGNAFLCYLRSSLFNRRKMNLVSIENVIQAIQYLAFIGKDIDGEIFIVSDDDQPMNNYQDVEKCLRRNLEVKDFSIPIIPLPEIFLSIALSALRRSNVNPSRVYSSKKLETFGYKGNVSIEEGITLFANWYKTEVLQGKLVER